MEKGTVGGGDDPARAVGMCDRLLTFLAKNLTMNRQKNITEGPRNGGSGSGNGSNDQKNHHAGEEDDDEFAVKIEKAEFELSHEEEEGGHRSFTATILEETSTDIVRASDRQKEATAEAAREAAAAAETATAGAAAGAAAVAAQGEKKVRKSVTIKEEAAGGKVDKKPSQVKKRQASSSGGQQVGTGGGPEEQKPAPPRWGLRPRIPSILRVPSNINEKSVTFIQERKRGFVGAAGKPEK